MSVRICVLKVSRVWLRPSRRLDGLNSSLALFRDVTRGVSRTTSLGIRWGLSPLTSSNTAASHGVWLMTGNTGDVNYLSQRIGSLSANIVLLKAGKTPPIVSLLAGGIAGSVEGATTVSADFNVSKIGLTEWKT